MSTSRPAPQELAAVPRGASAVPVMDASTAPAARLSEGMSDISDEELLLPPVPAAARGKEAALSSKSARCATRFPCW